MKIAVTTDHAGFEQLKQLKAFLVEQGHECVDFGPKELDMADDYPDFMFPAAKAVASGECEVGIILGGSGQGEAMAANRVKGARCTVFYAPVMPTGSINAEGENAKDEFEILRLSREHNLANMLALGARFLTPANMRKAVTTWLEAPLGTVDRHKRRAEKLDQL
jgi:ribose 5-phosphate isomerase B